MIKPSTYLEISLNYTKSFLYCSMAMQIQGDFSAWVETDQRSRLLPSTAADLISVKVNTSSKCYESESLITPSLLSSAKQASTMSLSSSSTDTV